MLWLYRLNHSELAQRHRPDTDTDTTEQHGRPAADMPSQTALATPGDDSGMDSMTVAAASANGAFYHHNIAAQQHANAILGTGLWRPESAPSTGRNISPSPLLRRLARGAGRRHQSESPSGRPARISDRRAGSSSSSGYRSYSANTHDTRYGSARSASISSGVPPPLSRDEFEALPVAIQRKYFSTLERLRFAQDSGVDGICQHYDDISAQNLKRRKSRQYPSGSGNISGRLRRQSLRESPVTDSFIYAALPDKLRKREFSREEQVILAGQLRASVILDAADEAVYRIGRRASTRQLIPDIQIDSPSLSTRRSMESVGNGSIGPLDLAGNRASAVPDSFYNSFRWVDEDEDLDLRLFLDDYHANLREALPQHNKERHPSFRRRMSVSKIPFSLPLAEPSQPPVKDTRSTASVSPSPSQSSSPFPTVPSTVPSTVPPQSPVASQHPRRKSRALSLIGPKHTAHTAHTSHISLSSIDPGAAHYQNPEARLKLRVYLASPQKFDEAIEFGFPSTEGVSDAATGALDANSPRRSRSRMHSRRTLSDNSNTMQTFLDDDDDDRLDTDQASVPDPESPRTPNLFSTADTVVAGHRPSESYAQAPMSSREMTLRMTLTRPDLRACEELMYGWQPQPLPLGRKSQSPLREDLAMGSSSRPKDSIDQLFAGIDHWGPDPPEKGMMKRFWHRMRRS
ncbi:hypothetical protein CMQ_1100 [Grosmannia clavigera kw1407]|uniref:Mucin n=1 Tax=Grosmannia clavigera (strain kw1407 / UAMH 11150) TaxID=655863 RepID=F0XDA0_GROCL|nr:uncharacterized protein CMQ_1100 [Grosmannia clavigera kw1407]EFX04172.1 hypothetical protein CMQ_1100 [Grosmannia clavigera kw1407]